MTALDVMQVQAGAAVWDRRLLVSNEWLIELTPTQRSELVMSARRAADRGHTFETLTRADFPLTDLAEPVQRWLRELREGRGFVLLRGFPVDLLEPAELELAYFGLGTHLGLPLRQNRAGLWLTPIADHRLAPDGPRDRLFKSRRAMPFHTDGVDVVGLLCVRPGADGGASRLVSAGTVYNLMLAHDAKLLRRLYEPLYWDMHSEADSTTAAVACHPAITTVHGRPRIDYIGWDIRDAQKHADVPSLTADQRAAMELLEQTVSRENLHVRMTFDAGDLQLINDRVLLHARDSFRDGKDPVKNRLLLRLWLADTGVAG